MEEIRVMFDSNKYLRKIPVVISLYDANNQLVLREVLEFTRMVIYQTEYYKRILLQTPESDVSDAVIEIQKAFDLKKKTSGWNSYLSLTAKPQGPDHPDSVVCFLDDFLAMFGEFSTASSERVFTSYLSDETFIIVDGEKIPQGIYGEHVESKTPLDEQEIGFIKEAMNMQASFDWFPSEKELEEIRIQLIKERIEMEKKEKKEKGGGLFSSKKKEPKQQAVAVMNEDGTFVNPKSLKTHKGSANPDYELENIIGLEGVKKDIQKMKYMLEYEKNRKQRGIETHDVSTLHMCFMGHPGTGKTTIARIMTGILFSMGYIKNNQCIEVSGLDLQGGYIGQTAIITKQIVDMAKGGILFVDEAYALCENKENSYGKEAVSVLLKEMEDNRGDLIVIFAGYADDMNKFLNVNPGFRSRINKYFDFADYTTVELGKIFLNYIKKMHLRIDEPAFTKCVELFKEAKKHPNFSNGRFVRNLTEKIEEEHIINCVDATDERMDTITLEDVSDELVANMLYGM